MAKLRLFGGTDPAKVASPDSVLVIGLGRFGQSLALELMLHGTDVLGIDADEEIVQSLNGRLTHVVRADATKEETLRQLAANEFERAVVAIGSDIEASILSASLLVRMGVRETWAKAVSDAHGAILGQLGVGHVVYPEYEMGRRVAHLVRGNMQDYLEVENDFVLIKTSPPAAILGMPLSESKVRSKYGVTISAVKRRGEPWAPATADTVLRADDVILISGPTQLAEAFSQMR